nr:MAG TPA: hypothetical protein [Caudoviricetes sp.]
MSPRYRNCNYGFSNANWNYGSRPLYLCLVILHYRLLYR